MPIYEFTCGACGDRFEELVPSSGEELPSCPSCGSDETERRYSTFATEWRPSMVKWHRLPGRKYNKPKPAAKKPKPD